MAPYEVVISGIGGHFPECENLAIFQQRLHNGDNLITSDDSRWMQGTCGVDSHTGKTPSLCHFDFPFFGMHRSVSNCSDPCTRKIMERTFEAIVDAGLNPRELHGSNTCVFVCAMNPEHESVFLDATQTRNPLGIVGASRSMLANRVSFFFNLKGRSCAYGASWIWGGCGLERAWAAISSGECDAALVGGCSLVMHAEMSVMLASMGQLAPDGVCRPFDANGCGLVRSEAQVVFLLQRADLARRAYATVLGATSGSIGPRSGNILTPSAHAITSIVTDLYDTCGVDRKQVQYVECLGSGYQPSDVAELTGVGDALCKGRDRGSPLLVGSVQGNVGHTEAASGLVSVAKVVTILETGQVPPTLNHKTPHPEIGALLDGRIKVVTEKSKIDVDKGLFAVSELSFGGEVGHVILKARSREKKIHKSDGLPRLVPLSGRTAEDLARILDKIQKSPFDPEYYALIHNVFRQRVNNHIFRGYTICPPPENFRPKVSQGTEVKRPLWFVFSGMGSQWPGMGRDLMRFPVFRETIGRCQQALNKAGAPVDLFKIMLTTDAADFFDILNCFLGITAVQIGLVNLLRQLGIQPDGYIGHSLGEQSCAYIDDCLTEEQTILAAYARGMASKDTPLIDGMMAAIGKGNADIQSMLPPTIDVACHNSYESCTISGPKKDVAEFVDKLVAQKIFARLVNVANIAYHSRYIQVAGPNLKKRLEKIIPEPRKRSPRWISSSVPEDRWDSEDAIYCSAEYMTNNLTHSVLFEEAFQAIPENAIILEIAPHGLLQAILRRCSPPGSINVSLTQRGVNDAVLFFLQAIGNLYAEGVEMNIAEIYPPVEFPVSRGTPSLAPLISWIHDEELFTIVDCLVTRQIEQKATIISDSPHDILQGVKVCSPAHLLMLAWKAVSSTHRLDLNEVRIIFQNIEFFEPIEIPSEGVVNLDLGVQVETKGFQVTANDRVIISGKALIDPIDDIFNQVFKDTHRVEESKQTEPVRLLAEDIYSDLAARGQEYLTQVKNISHIDVTEKDWIVHLKDNSWETLLASTLQAAQLSWGEHEQHCLYPKSIRRLTIDPKTFLSSHPNEVDITVRTETNLFMTEGFYVEGLYMESLDPANPLPQIRVSAPMFVKLGKQTELSAENLWTVAVHIIGEEQPWLNTISVIELKSTSGSSGDINFDLDTFENCANDLGFKTRHGTFQVNGVPPAAALSEMSTGSLVVCGSDSAKAATKLLDKAGAMVLIKLAAGAIPKELKHMAILGYSGDWVLLRHRTGLGAGVPDPEVIRMDTTDVAGLRLSERGTVLVWQQGATKESVKPIIDRMAETLDGVLFRLFFILDPTAPKFDLSVPMYREQLELGLRVNAYQAGSWGTVIEHNVPDNVGLPLTFESQLLSAIATKRNEGTEIHFWGTHDINLKQKRGTEVVLDYTGESSEGKVMGIAVARNGKPIADPILKWALPDKWSMEDGATVPIAYCQGLLALNVFCNIQPNENVFVLNAMGSEEQAFIHIALNNKCRVFAVVASDSQEKSLRRSLSRNISPNLHIVKIANKDIYISLRTLSNFTKLDVLVTRKASDLSFGLLSMIAYQGRIVYLGTPAPNTTELMGTNHFLRSTTIYGVSAGSILAMGDNYKKILADAMRKNLRSGAVKPLERIVIPAAVDTISWQDGGNVNVPRKMVRQVKQSTTHFSCNSGKTYLIAGGNLVQKMTLITWLARRGASHVVVAEREASKPLQRRARLFPHTTVLSEPDVASALKKANAMGKLDVALLFLQGFSKEEAARSIGEFRNENGSTLVVFNDSEQMPSGVVQAYEQVAANGVRTLLSEGAANKAVSTRLLDWLLRPGNAQQVIVRNAQGDRNSGELAMCLLDVLPKSVTSLAALTRSLPQSPRLKELPSIGPMARDAKEVFPLYAIAGFRGCADAFLQPLASHLLVPVISVQLPRRVATIQQTARAIAENIRAQQPIGPYSVFGSDWSTVLAEQVASELRKRNQVVKLFLLDAQADVLVKDAKELQARSDAELLLINSTLGINPLSKVHRRLASASCWVERLSVILPLLGADFELREAAADSLCFIRDWIAAIAHHTPDKSDLERHLIQSSAANEAEFKKNATTNICRITEPSNVVLASPKLHSYINSNMGWPLLQPLEARVAAVKT